LRPDATDRPSGLGLSDDSMCFCCGKKNTDGLRMEFEHQDGEVRTTISFAKRFQGYNGIVHGGLLSTVLDETMVTLLNRMGILAVTGELKVRFLSPLSVGQAVEIRAWLLGSRGRIFRVSASASLPDGTEVATAESTCLSMGRISE
jgi:uncharacterized protein (TIGR00369 family)